MKSVLKVDMSRHNLLIHPDLQIDAAEKTSGPPQRISGLTLGVVDMAQPPPHGGEMHPDGDEVLYVVSGRIRLIYDNAPDLPMVLAAGDACIIPAGEWHRLEVLEPARLIHVTPGPGGDARPA
ncbi:MAG: cupin domain-containing protein [Pseudomonadota bacterium]